MRINKCLLLVIICFGSINTVAAQQKQFTAWTAVFNTIKLGKKTGMMNDVQFRSSDELHHMQTLLIRPGFSYAITKKFTGTVGYAYISNRREVSGVAGHLPEHRIWEQLIYNHTVSRVAVAHRLRLEQRFLSKTVVRNNELDYDGYANAHRIRYFIRNVIPLKSGVPFTEGVFGAVQNEVFLNLGNKNAVNGKTFDQNRLYLAMGYRFSKKFDVEAGYMYQYVEGRNDATTNNNIVQLAGYLRL